MAKTNPPAVSRAQVRGEYGLSIFLSFPALFIAGFFALFIANRMFPGDIVLGTFALSTFWALYLSTLQLTFITVMLMPLVSYHEKVRGKDYTSRDWLLLYFVVNTASIWLLTRFSQIFGLGISHWWVALLLGAGMDWLQGLLMMTLDRVRRSVR